MLAAPRPVQSPPTITINGRIPKSSRARPRRPASMTGAIARKAALGVSAITTDGDAVDTSGSGVTLEYNCEAWVNNKPLRARCASSP